MTTPMMLCGDAASGTDTEGRPVCVAHAGLRPGAATIDPDAPDLTSRTSRCTCGREAPSDPARLAFFTHRPDRDHDMHYCGHSGWD